MHSLHILVLLSASVPAAGYLCALCNKLLIAARRRSSCREVGRGVVVRGRDMAPAGADMAATNCLLAVAMLRLALDQPQADMASAVPMWLLILHPLPLAWYWLEANVRRYLSKKRRGKLGGFRRSSGSVQFGFAGKFLRVSFGRIAGSFEDVQPQAIERITVL